MERLSQSNNSAVTRISLHIYWECVGKTYLMQITQCSTWLLFQNRSAAASKLLLIDTTICLGASWTTATEWFSTNRRNLAKSTKVQQTIGDSENSALRSYASTLQYKHWIFCRIEPLKGIIISCSKPIICWSGKLCHFCQYPLQHSSIKMKSHRSLEMIQSSPNNQKFGMNIFLLRIKRCVDLVLELVLLQLEKFPYKIVYMLQSNAMNCSIFVVCKSKDVKSIQIVEQQWKQFHCY